ncbi:hypothetical protein RhiirC2_794323 [Rhizophagus irregularis]|uniref:Uncharacterized protein n=1 Tax=Rhizophagus irregularis TaxID=588596 RepID=A0A2N1MDS9_9GLOM|nr:hypothetical protein RhiirC2_794323 [Rhizophagus irregularis]
MKGIYGIRLKWFGNIWYWIRILKRFKNMVLDMGYETVLGIHILVSCCRFSRFEFRNLDLFKLVYNWKLEMIGLDQIVNDKLCELYNKHLLPSHSAKRHNHFARPANSQQKSYADATGQKASS